MTSAHRPLGRYFRVLIGLGLSPLTGPACTGDTVTDSDSATPVTDCDCGGITTVTAGSSPGNVLARNIRVGLDAGSAVEVTCTLTESPGAWHQFVTAHADWQYLDDGSDPASGWREAGFAATGWSEGRAPLGYADEFNTGRLTRPFLAWGTALILSTNGNPASKSSTTATSLYPICFKRSRRNAKLAPCGPVARRT